MERVFAYDYEGLERWWREEGLETLTVEPSGHVVRAYFETNPAYAVTLITDQALLDEVTEGPPRAGWSVAVWNEAAAHLRAARRPGRTTTVVLRMHDFGPRARIHPWTWTLDGAPLEQPQLAGPHYAGAVDDRPGLAEGVPYAIAMRPGARRLEGGVSVPRTEGEPLHLALALDLTLAAGDEAHLDVRGCDPERGTPTRLTIERRG